MRILGLDFSSSQSSSKRNTVVECHLAGRRLEVARTRVLDRPERLQSILAEAGPWVIGIDFPFGLPRAFVDAVGWGPTWSQYVGHASPLSWEAFERAITAYRDARPDGQKRPMRLVDVRAKSQSPLTTVRTPVARMFHTAAGWLATSGCRVVPFQVGDADRVVVEAYPKLVARRLVGAHRYKDGEDEAQTREVRETLLNRIRRGDLSDDFGVEIALGADIVQECLHDGHGDVLDSVLCAIQAAWAFGERERGWGVPIDADPLEGWIVDPGLLTTELPAPPPPGAFNSSETRVRPVFRQLLHGDGTGRTWLPALLRLASQNRHYANTLAEVPGVIRVDALERRASLSPDEADPPPEPCFERALPPPREFLEWCIKNPDGLTPPQHASRASAATRRHRECLRGSDALQRARATREALSQLDDAGPQGSRHAWWAFEGFTSVDCCLETDRMVLLIEGKRFERPSGSVSWVKDRNQVARNLEVAASYARAHGDREYAVLVIGPTGTTGPTDTELRQGWPHLSPERQDELLAHDLGATSWCDVCQATGLAYDSLPVTAAEADS